jgi:hypothetical protein
VGTGWRWSGLWDYSTIVTRPENARETATEVAQRSGATPADAALIKVRIAETLAPFDAMHLLALVADVSSMAVPSDFPLPIVPQAVVEYFATILLERDDPAGSADPANGPAIREAAQRAIGEIESLMSLTLLARMIQSGHAATPLSQLSADLAFRESVFRWPSYPDQERRALAELFKHPDVRNALVQELGFAAEDALQLHDAMDRLIHAQREAHSRLHGELFAEHVVTNHQLVALSERDRAMVGHALQLGPDLVKAWSVTEMHLSLASGKGWQMCHGYLGLLASRFGEARGTSYAHGGSQVRSRPLVTDDDERYLPTSIDNALRALRPALEAALPKQVFDGTYQAHRATWVEEQTADAIRRALPEAQVWQNLRFDLDGTRNYEIDGLVRLDSLCVIIEVKGGRLPSGARGRNLKKALEALLGKASEQAGRLSRAIADGRSPPFRNAKTGSPVSVDLSGVTRVESIVVTLEDLGWLASRRGALRDLGLIAENDAAVPWVVSVFDLEVITELTNHPAEFTRYIALRHHLDERVLAFDELELWLLYLDESIDFSALAATMIMLDGRVAKYDDAKLLGRGELPRLRLSRECECEIQRLRRHAAVGWLEHCEEIVAREQEGRKPVAFPMPALPDLVVCAPPDRGLVVKSVRDLPLQSPPQDHKTDVVGD